MRVLFLPFEGVLHPDRVTFTLRGSPILEPSLAGHRLFEQCTSLERLLEPHADARIVLSTPWVDHFGLTYCLKCLPQALRQRLVGTTSEIRAGSDVGLPLFEQAQLYALKRKLIDWVVLCPRGTPHPDSQASHVVPTDPFAGIGDEGAQFALSHWLESSAPKASGFEVSKVALASGAVASPRAGHNTH